MYTEKKGKQSRLEMVIIYSDSTHLKANANKKKVVEKQAKSKATDCIDDLEPCINEDRAAHGKKPSKFNGDEWKDETEEEKEPKGTRNPK